MWSCVLIGGKLVAVLDILDYFVCEETSLHNSQSSLLHRSFENSLLIKFMVCLVFVLLDYLLSHAVSAEWLFVSFGEGGKGPEFVRAIGEGGKDPGFVPVVGDVGGASLTSADVLIIAFIKLTNNVYMFEHVSSFN